MASPLAATPKIRGGFVQTIRRVASHLFRYNARWGYLLFAVCILIYNFVPQQWAAADSIRQFVLILASVAVGAILLPELPSNLWRIDVERVRNLIPTHQRETLAQALISAESSDARWNALVWTKGLQPLLLASQNPRQYVLDMDYDVHMHLDRTLALGTKKVKVHAVSVDQKATRSLGKRDVDGLWLSIARTPEALTSEFTELGCLARELVPLGDLEGLAWQEAVKEHCSARLFIDGAPVDLVPEVSPVKLDVVRWRVTRPIESDSARVRIMFDFYMDADVRDFPVMFSGYYCAGTTDIAFRLYNERSRSVLRCEYFVARALESSDSTSITASDTAESQQITFSTGKDSILWPGSGVEFRWEPAAA